MTSTLITQYIGKGTAGARPATPAVAAGTFAWYYATDTGALSYWDGAAWHTANVSGGIDLFSPPLAANFPTIINGAGASPAPSVTDTAYGMLFDSGPTQASDAIRAALQNIPNATTFTVILGVRITMAPINYRSCGLFLSDGAKFVAIHQQSSILQVTRYANLTTFASNQAQMTGVSLSQWYLKIQGDGTNLKFNFSQDGRNWIQLYSEALGAFLGTITKVGIGADANANTTPPAAGDHIFGDVFYWSASTP